MVTDADRLVRDAAIRALANNPDSAAGDKLRAAFKVAGDDGLRVALANALGFRGEPASVEMLARAIDRTRRRSGRCRRCGSCAGQDRHARGHRRC